MRLGILQTGHVPSEVETRFGDYTTLYGAMFPARGYQLTTYSVVDGAFPDAPANADAWLVTGSRHGAYEDHGWIAPLEGLIRAIRDSGQPLIGVCFGHQIIAQALGGRVEKFEGGWTVGAQDYAIGDARLTLNAWHQDQVTALPPGAMRLGSSAACENAVLAYGDRILTVQPHPEFGDGVIDLLIRHCSDTVPDHLKSKARARIGQTNHNLTIHDWIARVIEGGSAQTIPVASALAP